MTGSGANVFARLTTETRRAFTTTEFYAYLAAVAAVLIASWVIDSGDGGAGSDPFRADEAWRLVAFLTVGYLVSRGLAKAGSREPYWAGPNDLPGNRGDDNGERR